MKVQIISVDFDTDIPKADGSGSYKGVLLSFKDLDKGTLKQKGIHENVFNKTDTLRTKLPELKKGDIVNFKFNAVGKFQNLVDIEKIVEEPKVEPKPAGGWKKTDPAVDQARQTSICKQSAVTQVINLFIATGTISVVDAALIDDIIEKADRIVRYTNG